jgi:hypothetical protein
LNWVITVVIVKHVENDRLLLICGFEDLELTVRSTFEREVSRYTLDVVSFLYQHFEVWLLDTRVTARVLIVAIAIDFGFRIRFVVYGALRSDCESDAVLMSPEEEGLHDALIQVKLVTSWLIGDLWGFTVEVKLRTSRCVWPSPTSLFQTRNLICASTRLS